MSVIEFQMKTHSRVTITDEFAGLNNCSIHGIQPVIERVAYGRKKYTSYIITCQHRDCSRCTDDKSQVVAIWNKWNPRK
jgi:hypothetical protein